MRSNILQYLPAPERTEAKIEYFYSHLCENEGEP